MASKLTGTSIICGSGSSDPAGTREAGELFYNTTQGLFKYHDGSNWKKVSAELSIINSISVSSYSGYGGTISLSGDGFLSSSCTVTFSANGVTSATVVVTAASNNSITNVSVPAAFAALSTSTTINVTVTNADGSTSSPVTFQNLTPPTWSTSAGSIGSRYTTQSASYTLSASFGSQLSFSIVSGSLPPGLSLSTSGNNAIISGTVSSSAAADYSSSTYNFTVRASGAGINVDRAFSLTINSKYVGYRCTTAGENGGLSDTAPSGYYFTRVDFSSYGTPNGSCGAFTIGSCNSASSNNYNPTPTQSYSTSASNGTWGDPCGGTQKRMYIQMSYGPNI